MSLYSKSNIKRSLIRSPVKYQATWSRKLCHSPRIPGRTKGLNWDELVLFFIHSNWTTFIHYQATLTTSSLIGMRYSSIHIEGHHMQCSICEMDCSPHSHRVSFIGVDSEAMWWGLLPHEVLIRLQTALVLF